MRCCRSGSGIRQRANQQTNMYANTNKILRAIWRQIRQRFGADCLRDGSTSDTSRRTTAWTGSSCVWIFQPCNKHAMQERGGGRRKVSCQYSAPLPSISGSKKYTWSVTCDKSWMSNHGRITRKPPREGDVFTFAKWANPMDHPPST